MDGRMDYLVSLAANSQTYQQDTEPWSAFVDTTPWKPTDLTWPIGP